MKNYEFLTQNVVDEIRRSPEYTNYHRVLKKIMQDEQLYDTMNKYRQRLLEIQLDKETDTFVQMKELRVEYDAMFEKPLAGEFLLAEQRLTKMGREITSAILKSLELDTGFMDQE